MRAIVKSVSYWDYRSNDKNESGVQIDVLIEYHNNIYDIVECKYYNGEFTITGDYAKNLINKKERFIQYGIGKRKKYDIKLIILSTYGTRINRYYNSVNVAQDILLEDLMG